MTSLLALRSSNNAASVLLRCVSALSRGQLRSEGSASVASAASAAVSSSFDLRQRRGIGSRSIDDDAASRSTSHPAPTPDDFARVASGAAADVARVVNQLNSELEQFFGSGLPSGPSGGSSGGGGGDGDGSSSSSSSSSSRGFASSSPPPPPPPPPSPRKAAPPRAKQQQQQQQPTTKLTHVDGRTGAASMVDVGPKAATRRVAVARGRVVLGSAAAFAAVEANAVAKGDVLSLARVAGILGAKAVPSLVPLCHTVVLDQVRVSATLDGKSNSVELEAEASATGRTGVEMEALAAVTSAALTVYDMTKAMAKGSVIEGVRLVSKSGGRSGEWRREGEEG